MSFWRRDGKGPRAALPGEGVHRCGTGCGCHRQRTGVRPGHRPRTGSAWAGRSVGRAPGRDRGAGSRSARVGALASIRAAARRAEHSRRRAATRDLRSPIRYNRARPTRSPRVRIRRTMTDGRSPPAPGRPPLPRRRSTGAARQPGRLRHGYPVACLVIAIDRLEPCDRVGYEPRSPSSTRSAALQRATRSSIRSRTAADRLIAVVPHVGTGPASGQRILDLARAIRVEGSPSPSTSRSIGAATRNGVSLLHDAPLAAAKRALRTRRRGGGRFVRRERRSRL